MDIRKDNQAGLMKRIDDAGEALIELTRALIRIPTVNPPGENYIEVCEMTDETAPVVRSVASAIETVLGRKPQYVVSPGSYDQKHIDRIGRLKDCIAYGPGILDLAHQPDEYVGIDDMADAAKFMALSLCALLSGPA